MVLGSLPRLELQMAPQQVFHPLVLVHLVVCRLCAPRRWKAPLHMPLQRLHAAVVARRVGAPLLHAGGQNVQLHAAPVGLVLQRLQELGELHFGCWRLAALGHILCQLDLL